jgi:hypothetical protein
MLVREWKEGVMDAVGPYPMTCLDAESDLEAGLESLRGMHLVTVVFVVDGLTGPSPSRLSDTFEVARPFKTHYLVDQVGKRYEPSAHHRYEIRRARQRDLDIRILPLYEILDAWTDLYEDLVRRHDIRGMPQFSRDSFARLAECPGLSAVAAFVADELVSCHLWFEFGGNVWSHLAASSANGYARGAAYAVYDASIIHFADRIINLGGIAGDVKGASDGLARFKQGFANGATTAFLIGSVLNRPAYEHICTSLPTSTPADYFPRYRAPAQGDT